METRLAGLVVFQYAGFVDWKSKPVTEVADTDYFLQQDVIGIDRLHVDLFDGQTHKSETLAV